MNLKPVLSTLALALSACAPSATVPQAIPAVAQQRQCPAYPLPPAALIELPVKVDFLTPSSQPSRPSNSTN